MMRSGVVWLLLLSALLPANVIPASDSSLSTIQQLNRKYDVCVSGPEQAVMDGITNPINKTMETYVRDLTARIMVHAPNSTCEDMGLCPIPEKWMIPQSSLDDLKNVLVRSTFDVSMENSIKEIPKPSRRRPLNITLSVFIESVSSVDEKHNDFAVSLFLVQKWTLDQFRCLNSYKAMAFKGVDVYRKFGNRSTFFDYMGRNFWLAEWPEDEFKLEPEHFQLFWLPDIFLANAKSQFPPYASIDTRFLDVVIRSASRDVNMLTQRATLNECHFRYVQEFNAKVSCNFNFIKYPIDVQNCQLFFRSFSHTPQDLNIILDDVQTDPSINLGNQYLSVSFQRHRIWPPKNAPGIRTLRGQRSVGRIQITLNRSLASVFVGVMIPAILVVVIDLTMFWIRISDLSDRISVGILCLFTLLTQFSASRSAIATNSYITLMDWFMMLCIGTVVAQMTQTIAVYIIYNREMERMAEMESRTKKWRNKEQKGKKKPDKTMKNKREAGSCRVTESRASSIGKRVSAASRSLDTEGEDTLLRRNVSANRLSLRRRRRIVYPAVGPASSSSLSNEPDIRSGNRETTGRQSQRSIHDVEQKTMEQRMAEVHAFLLEPAADRSSPQYLPMKIDAVSRILFPVTFATLMTAYAFLAAHLDERQ